MTQQAVLWHCDIEKCKLVHLLVFLECSLPFIQTRISLTSPIVAVHIELSLLCGTHTSVLPASLEHLASQRFGSPSDMLPSSLLPLAYLLCVLPVHYPASPARLQSLCFPKETNYVAIPCTEQDPGNTHGWNSAWIFCLPKDALPQGREVPDVGVSPHPKLLIRWSVLHRSSETQIGWFSSHNPAHLPLYWDYPSRAPKLVESIQSVSLNTKQCVD